MIDHEPGIRDLFRIFGSVLPRTVIWALLGAVEGAICDWSDLELFQFRNGPKGNGLLELWHHPWALHVYAMVIGFALVMRVQIAYARFWEGATMLRQCTVKLTSAVVQLMSFDEVGKSAWDDAAFNFRLKIIHFASLLHAVVLIDVRGDAMHTKELALRRTDPFLFRVRSRGDSVIDAPSKMSPGMKRRSSAVTRTNTIDLGSLNGSAAKYAPASPSGLSGRGSAAIQPHESTPKARGGPEGRAQVDEEELQSGKAVPMRMILAARAVLGRGTGQQFNSFSAVDALEAGRQGLNASAQHHERMGTALSETFVSVSEYIWTTILLQHSRGSLSKLAVTNSFDVVGGVEQDELDLLLSAPPADRSYMVLSWILRLMSERLQEGGLAIAPPIVARAYQEIADAHAAAGQAAKLADTPFPYPLRQLLALMLAAFQILVPMCVAAFIDSPALVATLSFFTCLGYMGLNEVARELELPYGLGANHLPVVAYQEAVNTKVARLLDLSKPKLNFAYALPVDTVMPIPPPTIPTVDAPPRIPPV